MKYRYIWGPHSSAYAVHMSRRLETPGGDLLHLVEGGRRGRGGENKSSSR